MEWISVEDRLPEHGKSVLVSYSDGDVHIETYGNNYTLDADSGTAKEVKGVKNG